MNKTNRLFISAIISFFLCVPVFAEGKIKHPNVAGYFYPSSKRSLSSQIDGFYEKAKGDADLGGKEIHAIMVPHAGYVYSGQVAAYAFKAVKGRSFDAVFVIAPSHFYGFEGASVYKEGSFRTPLGDIEVDSELAQRLILASAKVDFMPQAFDKEHSLEVELPFLQKSLDKLRIVPIIVGQIDYSDAAKLAKVIIDTTRDKKILLVISTDLSHYHPHQEAVDMDSKVISYVENLDELGLWKSNLKKECELCGLYPVLILLNYAKKLELKPKVLNYANSGDVTGDKSGVVGYVSVAFFRDEQDGFGAHTKLKDKHEIDAPAVNIKLKGEDEMFNEAQKKRLLEIVRQTITEYVTSGVRPDFDEDDPQLNIKRGAFVTLHKEGMLRGCIGSFTSDEPICKLVYKMAIQSATADPRFSPVTKQEIDSLNIEISVLTEPKLIDDWKKIKLGIDGVIIRRGFSSGVFLPQVATETGWDLETFLGQLCSQKAGLPADCYKNSSTQIYTFQAFVFSEKD